MRRLFSIRLHRAGDRDWVWSDYGGWGGGSYPTALQALKAAIYG